MNKEQRVVLMGFAVGVEQVRKVQADMPAQTIATLLAIHKMGEPTISELAARLGYARSTASRNVAALTDVDRHGNPGLDFVKKYYDPKDNRNRLVTLTPKGTRFLESLATRILEVS